MIELLETAIDVAENYANNPNSVDLLAGACAMGVVTVDNEDGSSSQGINIFFPDNGIDEPPAFAQIAENNGIVNIDDGIDLDSAEEMLEGEILEARDRINFCQKALQILRGNQSSETLSNYLNP
jgi:hypothetical protein